MKNFGKGLAEYYRYLLQPIEEEVRSYNIECNLKLGDGRKEKSINITVNNNYFSNSNNMKHPITFIK